MILRSAAAKDEGNALTMFQTLEETACTSKYSNSNPDSSNRWIMRMVMDKEAMLDKDLTMDDIHFCLDQYTKESVYSDYNNDELVFRLSFDPNDKLGTVSGEPLDQTDEIYYLKNIQDKILNNIILRGIQGISTVNLRKIQGYRKPDSPENKDN